MLLLKSDNKNTYLNVLVVTFMEVIWQRHFFKKFFTNPRICIPACMPGYVGINCTIRCTYPLYGHRCQGVCDCDEGMCDVSTGCEPISTGGNLVYLVNRSMNLI